MKKVTCKFTCESVTNYQGQKVAKLNAVHGTEGDNADFTKFTPSGSIEITIQNDAPAADAFTPGKNYYVSFEEAVAE